MLKYTYVLNNLLLIFNFSDNIYTLYRTNRQPFCLKVGTQTVSDSSKVHGKGFSPTSLEAMARSYARILARGHIAA